MGAVTHRRRLGPWFCSAGLLAIAVAFLLPTLLVAGHTDTILLTGLKILTPHVPLTVADAVAIRDERRVAVGTTAAVMARLGGFDAATYS